MAEQDSSERDFNWSRIGSMLARYLKQPEHRNDMYGCVMRVHSSLSKSELEQHLQKYQTWSVGIGVVTARLSREDIKTLSHESFVIDIDIPRSLHQ